MCKDIYDVDVGNLGYDEIYEKFGQTCIDKCRPECHNRYYNYCFDSKEINGTDHMTFIYIHHNQLPDQLTEHIEDITFIDFFGTFGGLFGIWLGLSAFAIFKTMSDWIVEKKKKLLKINDNVQEVKL